MFSHIFHILNAFNVKWFITSADFEMLIISIYTRVCKRARKILENILATTLF